MSPSYKGVFLQNTSLVDGRPLENEGPLRPAPGARASAGFMRRTH